MIVYCITHKESGKVYVGQTVKTLHIRKLGHLRDVKNGSKYPLHRAIRKYGEDGFEWSILCECNTKEELDKKEKYYIKKYRAKRTGCYNLTDGGEGGDVFTNNPNKDSIRKKLSIAAKGRVISDEIRKKISISQKGIKRPQTSGELNPSKRPDVIKKLREINMGEKNPMYGKKFTDEQKRKVSEGLMGHIVTPETREKIRKANIGKTHTEETKAKIRAKRSLQVFSECSKRKRIETRKKNGWYLKDRKGYIDEI